MFFSFQKEHTKGKQMERKKTNDRRMVTENYGNVFRKNEGD